MKLKTKILSLFLLCVLFASVQAESFKLSYETISVSSAQKELKYKNLGVVFPRHHKTIIKIHGLPEAEDYVLRWERPLFAEKNFQQKYHFFVEKYFLRKYHKKAFTRLNELLGDEDLIIVTDSGGFLPGEEVTWTLESLDGKFKSESITFIPHPIVQEIPLGGAKLKAKLVRLWPTSYEIYLEGIQTYEKLNLSFVSSGELFNKDFYYAQNTCIAISSEMIGMNDGVLDLTLTRQKGSQFKLGLPFGKEVLKYRLEDLDPVVSDFTPISNKTKGAK